MMVSCKITQPSSYFKNLKKDTTLAGSFTSDFELKIMKGDRLSIAVSSLSTVEDALFNSAGSGEGSTAGSTTKAGGYVVQQDGTVLLHRLVTVQAAGTTRKELSRKLEERLLTYMKEPIVQVNFLNHKVTVMGEVRTPQILNMPDEPLTIINALILSEDVTANAKRNNIAIIREEWTEKKESILISKTIQYFLRRCIICNRTILFLYLQKLKNLRKKKEEKNYRLPYRL